MRVRGFISVVHWLGGRDADQLAPAAMRYRAKLASASKGACAGCLFRGQAAAICGEAGQLAQRAGLPDCEATDPETGRTFIYVALEVDPRQLEVVNCAAAAP
jgi:hypothetical protein